MDGNNPSARPSDNSEGENPADASATSSGAAPETKPYDLGVIKDGVTDIPIVYQYAQRIGATLRGMRKLVVRERHGAYFADIAEVRFTNDGEVIAPAGFEPTNAEAAAIREAWPRYKWPEYSPYPCSSKSLRNDPDRFPFQRTDAKNLAVFWDQKRACILMVEERIVTKSDGKTILLWTPWSDGKWRIAEPPDRLPLFGLETIAGAVTIFVHEGPKAAQVVQRLIADDGRYEGAKRVGGWRDHPWGEFLGGGRPGSVAHVAWAGGAMRPEATDFSPLKVSGANLIFVADNDRPGTDAIHRISRSSLLKMSALRFTQEWPYAFDLGDPFPSAMAQAGSSASDHISPATWATKEVPTGRAGRPAYEMRADAIADWLWTVAPPLFFHTAYPGRAFTETEVDALMRPFSHADRTARLIRKNFSARADGVAYLPGHAHVIQRGKERLVNLWTPCRIPARDGSAWPLGRLLVHLFPNRQDRKHLVRWGATLAACPQIRMEYAVLLRTETQGTGKNTLGNIAAEMVGQENVSRPNEAALSDSNFNSYLAKKRLVIVDEIYSGQSRKTYNRLKAPITDTRIRVNEKYQPEYEIDNFAHFIFSSNDMIAILIDGTDRRFFVPEMSERKLPHQFWDSFHAWLGSGGLGIIRRCADEFVARHGAVQAGQAAPMTAAKAAMVESSVSDEMRAARDAAADIIERGNGDNAEKVAITLEDFHSWHGALCRARGWHRLTGNRLNEALRRAGLFIRGRDDKAGFDHRVRIGNRTRCRLASYYYTGWKLPIHPVPCFA